MFENRITRLFKIKYPIIQAGMIWCSGWELASAVSNAGGLGIIGSGSMYPETLEEHVKKCKAATTKPFAVNLPLIYPDIDKHIQTIIKHKVPIVFSSAGNPKTYTPILKENGIIVVHVVPGTKYAVKSQKAGVDAVVGEGFEAGGHNGREETTTLCLIPNMVENVGIPVIAAGGIGSGEAMLAMFALGAEGVQMGSRFVASKESSAHINFKQKVIETREGETQLALKKLTPVRLIKNDFFEKVQAAEKEGASKEELKNLLGRGRAKSGMFEGELDKGELEIGQVAALINDLKPAGQIVQEIWEEFIQAHAQIKNLNI
jgi:enoyl-[acyl-carrier protein] reductase II